MRITNFNDLKQNELFVQLHHAQAECDSNDPAMQNSHFTRSPLHAIQFLITYAGLDQSQRQYVISQLSNDQILTKESLDALILDIDWVSLLQAPAQSTLNFKFTVGLANRNSFIDAIRTRCPHLFQALNHQECIVQIEETDEVVFTTTIAQNELWAREFTRANGEDFWSVRDFNLSPALQIVADTLEPGSERVVGGFTIRKGTGRAARNVELHIPAPRGSNQFSMHSEVESEQQGIYGAFVGLTDFYGLDRVDEVAVKLQNEANFSDKGASSSQTQVNTYSIKSAFMSVDEPTVITVNQLNVFFQGADIVVNFSEDTVKSDEYNILAHINIPTQSGENTGITLLAGAPKAAAASFLAIRSAIGGGEHVRPATEPQEIFLSRTQPKNEPSFSTFSKKDRSIRGITFLGTAINQTHSFKTLINDRYISRVDGFFKPYTSRLDFAKGLVHPVTYPAGELFRAGFKYPVLMIRPALSAVLNLITFHPVYAAANFGAFAIYAGLAIASAVVAVLSSLLALTELLTRSVATLVSPCINYVNELNDAEDAEDAAFAGPTSL